MKKLTREEKMRLDELEEKARDKFIECSDYNVADWLDDKEAKEWKKLFDRWLVEEGGRNET